MYGIYYKQHHSYMKHHPSEYSSDIEFEGHEYGDKIYYHIKNVDTEDDAREFISKDLTLKMSENLGRRVHSDLVYKKIENENRSN